MSQDRTEILKAAAAHARGEDPPGLLCSLQSRANGRRSAERDRLVSFAESENLFVTEFPKEVENLSVSGNEHSVDLTVVDGRIRKYTSRGRPAGFTFLLNEDHIPVRLIHALPSEYLERQALQNEIFGDEIGLESVTQRGRFCISQPYRSGELPEVNQVHAFLEAKGFEPRQTQGDELYFLHPDGIMIGDTKPQNWCALSADELIPIDILITDLRDQF